MRTALCLALLLFHLAGISVQSPTGQQELDQNSASSSKVVSNELRSPPVRSLYSLVDQRMSRGSSKTETEQYHKDFAAHPDVAKIDLNSKDREETIRQLRALRVPTAGRASQVWNHKLTLALLHLIEDKATDPRLLQDLKAVNHRERKMAGNLSLQQRRKTEEGHSLRLRDIEYVNRRREKRKSQRQEGQQDSSMDKPMRMHLGAIASRSNRPTAQQIVERANEFRHLYTTGQAFQGAMRVYLRQANYDEKESSLAIAQRGYQAYNKAIREQYAMKKMKLIRQGEGVGQPPAPATMLGQMTSSWPSSEKRKNSSEEQSGKRARIAEHLAKNDWWKAHKL